MKAQSKIFVCLLFPLLAACQNAGQGSSDDFSSLTDEGDSSQNPSSSAFSAGDSHSDQPTSSEDASVSEASSSEPQILEKTFSHVFKKGDFPSSSKGGAASINGIDFDYTAITFLGQNAEGMQIGSINNPQRSPFVLSFSVPEGAVLGGYSFYAKGSSFSGMVSVGELENPFAVKSNVLQEVSLDGFMGDSFALSIQSDGKYAFYLYSLSLTFYVTEPCSFSPSSDEDNASPLVQGEGGIPKSNFPSMAKEEYYAGTDLSLRGDKLRNELVEKSSKKSLQRYSDAKTMLPYIDENPNKPGYMVGLYDGDDLTASWDGSWNREHVWACAHLRVEGPSVDVRPGESKRSLATDLHNLHPACTISNGVHSDKMFGSEEGGLFYPNLPLGFPHKGAGDFRGDIARTIFYMYATYPELRLVDSYTDLSYLEMGSLKELLEWNELDPVDDYESRRNERVFSYQGNRNPFIDYPSLAEALFE